MIERAPRLEPTDPASHVATGLAKIGLVLRHEAWQQRTGTGLTPTQAQLLSLMSARPGGATLSELADELGVSAASASDSLTKLVAKGLATKRRADGNGRALAAKLTALGQRRAAEVAVWPDFLLAAVDELDPEERAVFLRALVRMIRSLQEQGRIPVARMCPNCRFFLPNVHSNAAQPHHCAFTDAPFGDGELRIDCSDSEPQAAGEAGAVWRAFVSARKEQS
jgi:DNA-binding MarR family transcriptional regulator